MVRQGLSTTKYKKCLILLATPAVFPYGRKNKALVCPTGANPLFDRKREISELSNRERKGRAEAALSPFECPALTQPLP
jgi:hypothetical protein